MYYSNEKIEYYITQIRRLLKSFYSQQSQTITIELNKGELVLLSIPQESNHSCSQQYTLANFIPKVLLRNFMRLSNLFMLFISLIMMIGENLSPFSIWIIPVQVAANLLIYLILELACDLQRRKEDNYINQRITKRGTNTGAIEDVLWSDISIGDIVFLNKGDLVPADIIVLDTGQVRDREAVCMVDTQWMDGLSSLTKKKSSYLTQLIVLRTRQKSQFSEYRKLLTGKLEYDLPNGNIESFNGLLKLKKDPKNEHLNIDNFIPKGAKIMQTSWLFGLVVYTGQYTKAHQCSKFYKAKASTAEEYFNLIVFGLIWLLLLYTLISIIVLMARSDENNFVIQTDQNTQNGNKIFNLLILYSQLIPCNFYLIYDFITLIKKGKNLHNPTIMNDLGNIDYILIDKTGTLTTSYCKLENFLFGSLAFTLNHDSIFTILNKKEEEDVLKLASIHEEYLIPMEYDTLGKKTIMELMPTKKTNPNIPTIINNQNIFKQVLEPLDSPDQIEFPNSVRNQDQQMLSLRKSFFQHKKRGQLLTNNDEFLSMIQQYKNKSPQMEFQENQNDNALYYDTFMKCLLLCHEARPVYGLETTYESYSESEEIALSFAKLCGYQLESFNKFESPDAYQCKIQGEKIKYNILGLNSYTQKRNLTSVVIQSPKSGDIGEWELNAVTHLSGEGSKGGSLLICKGDYEAINQKLLLSPKEREELESHVQTLKMRGVRIIIYATRVLNQQQTEEFHKEFNLLKSSLTNQDHLLEQLAINFEQQLFITGMIGFREELKKDAQDLIQTAKNCNIHVWLLSGDQEAPTIGCAQAIELNESQYSKYLKIFHTDRESIWLQINNILGTIQTEMQRQSNFNELTMINSTKTIFEHINYQKMLKFILIINGASLKIIYDDIDLLGHFEFLLGLCRNVIGYRMTPQSKEQMCRILRNQQKTVLAIGDGYNDRLMMQYANVSIEVVNNNRNNHAGDITITELNQIKKMLIKGKENSEIIHQILMYIFYCSSLIAMTLFFYNWFCYFTATSIHESYMIFLYSMLFVGMNSLFIGFDKINTEIISDQFPSLYIDGQIRIRHFIRLFQINLTESFLLAALIFYSTIYMFNHSMDNDGRQSDFSMVSLGLMYNLILISIMKITPILGIRGLFGQFILICCLIIIIVSSEKKRIITQQIFSRFYSITCLIFTLSSSLLIRQLFSVLRLSYLPTVFEQFAFKNKDQFEIEMYTAREILGQCIDNKVHISKISNVLSQCSMISPYIQEMLNPGDMNVIEMKLSPFLNVNDLVVETKFRSSVLISSLNNFRLFSILLISYFAAYCLTDYLVNLALQSGIMYLALFALSILIVLYVMSNHMAKQYYQSSHILMFLLVIIKIVIDWLSEDISLTLSSLLLLLFTTFNSLNLNVTPIFLYNILYLVQLIARIVIVLIYEQSIIDNRYSRSRIVVFGASTTILLMIALTLRQLFTFYTAVKHRRTEFLGRFSLEQDRMAANDILSILVPHFVRQSIQTNQSSFQEAQDDVSILFCYICDFDSIMREEGKNVVLMLDSLFRIFDNLCLQHGVQKIETVGYTYMAATGIRACEININPHMLRTEKTMRLVNMAYDMMQQVQERKYGKGTQIEMKIGIHVGRVIAGVIGHHKPQFSLIGDPVNQTSRVGSTGDAGSITLSEQAFKQAKAGIKYYIKKQKEAKGLGLIDTYSVFKTRPINYQIPINQLRWQQLAKAALKQKRQLEGSSKNIIIPVKKSFLESIKYNLAEFGSQRLSSSPKTAMMQSLLQVPSLQEQRRGSQMDSINIIQSAQQLNSEETELILEQEYNELISYNKLLMIPNSEGKINFYNIIGEQQLQETQFGLIMLILIYFIITLLIIIVRRFFGDDYNIFIVRAFFIISLIILLPFVKHIYTKLYLNLITILIMTYGVFTVIYQAYLSNSQLVSTISLLELMFIILVTCSLKTFSFIQMCIFMIITFIFFLTLYISDSDITHFYIFYLICAEILCLIAYYKSQEELISMFNNLQLNEEKKNKQTSLVSQLLPTHAYIKMKNTSLYNRSDFIDEFDDVTLLFADIKGFTEYSHTQTPEGVVTMLRNLFTEFDKLCLQYNVYKMYTIGDCYVVMGFLQSGKRNPIQEAINTVKMGFSMVDIIMDVRKQINFPLLNMRIGIHTGQVIGGIIGTDIVRYDIYGKDVTIANKMESSGQEGHVQISETTKLMIERADRNPFSFQYHQDVELAKFNMQIKGYLVHWDRKDRTDSNVRRVSHWIRGRSESKVK